jgi:hypothetical protein
VEHPGSRARHGLRAPRTAGGQLPQAVRERLRRRGEGRDREHADERGARAGRPDRSCRTASPPDGCATR